MKGLKKLVLLASIAAMPLITSCDRDGIVEVQYKYPAGVLGNIEYERYGDFSRDDYDDGDIDAVLTFEDYMYGFQPGDVVAYYKTVDTDPVNYWFKFIPEGKYALEASLWDLEKFIFSRSSVFHHADEEDSYVNLKLRMPLGKTSETTGGRKRTSGIQATLAEKLLVSEKMYGLMEQNISNNHPEELSRFRVNVAVMTASEEAALKQYIKVPKKELIKNIQEYYRQ